MAFGKNKEIEKRIYEDAIHKIEEDNKIKIVDKDIQFFLYNWEYKNKVYKTININSIITQYKEDSKQKFFRTRIEPIE